MSRYTPEQMDAMLATDPESLTPLERGAIRAIAYRSPDLDKRALARQFMANAAAKSHPSEAYRRGAERARDYPTT